MSWEYSSHKNLMFPTMWFSQRDKGNEDTALDLHHFYSTVPLDPPSHIAGSYPSAPRSFSLDPWTILLEKQVATPMHIRTTWGASENPNAQTQPQIY